MWDDVSHGCRTSPRFGGVIVFIEPCVKTHPSSKYKTPHDLGKVKSPRVNSTQPVCEWSFRFGVKHKKKNAAAKNHMGLTGVGCVCVCVPLPCALRLRAGAAVDLPKNALKRPGRGSGVGRLGFGWVPHMVVVGKHFAFLLIVNCGLVVEIPT